MSLRKEVIEIKGTINKIYEHIVEVLKIINRIDDHGNRIQKLENKVEHLEMNMTNIKVHGCEPIQNGDEITFQELGEILKDNT